MTFIASALNGLTVLVLVSSNTPSSIRPSMVQVGEAEMCASGFGTKSCRSFHVWLQTALVAFFLFP
jgi:hypothetical protein